MLNKSEKKAEIIPLDDMIYKTEVINKEIDLVKKLNLNKIDKIIIITEKFALTYTSLINKEITDESIIYSFTDTLRLLKEIPVCDTRPQYTITFYKNAQQIASFGFFIDGDWYFIRLDSKDGQKDYKPGRDFVEIWNKLSTK